MGKTTTEMGTLTVMTPIVPHFAFPAAGFSLQQPPSPKPSQVDAAEATITPSSAASPRASRMSALEFPPLLFTLLGPCTLLEETTDPDPLNPGEVQTGLWDVSFEATHPIVEPITTVTRFDTREFEVSGELFGSSTLNTKDYGKKGTNPNKLGVQGCFSMHDDPGVPGVPRTRSTTLDPVLPLDPGETMWLVCYDGLNPGANLNLRRRGGSLAQYLLNPENVTVRITRDLP